MTAEFAGLREAHVHLPELGAELSAVNLEDCASKAECLERIARRSDETAPGAWVLAVRARAEGWTERAWPTARELDEAAGGRPVAMKSFDIHSLVASDAALRAIGIEPGEAIERGVTSGWHGSPSRASERDLGGVAEGTGAGTARLGGMRGPDATSKFDVAFIDYDERGVPTGLLFETMAQRVLDAMPMPTVDERREHVRLACADLAARGFVETHDMLSKPTLWADLAALADAGALPIRVLLHPLFEDFDRACAERASFERDAVRLGGLKVFTDGTLNSRTAWMLYDYADPRPDTPNGRRLLDDDGFVAALEKAEAVGMPIVAHAIGDAAVRRCLDLIERHGSRAIAHRIEHAEFIDEADTPRFARLNVVASVQPCHLLPDMEAIRRLTPGRADRVLPLRELIQGAVAAGRDPRELIWFGSDAPVVDPDPADNLQAAVERRRAGMPAWSAIAPQQALTRVEAMELMRAPRESVFG